MLKSVLSEWRHGILFVVLIVALANTLCIGAAFLAIRGRLLLVEEAMRKVEDTRQAVHGLMVKPYWDLQEELAKEEEAVRYLRGVNLMLARELAECKASLGLDLSLLGDAPGLNPDWELGFLGKRSEKSGD